MPSIITLTTDFGKNENYIAVMKGVILSINPKAQIIDITHSISPYNIKEGAFILSCVYGYFPKGTVHVVVVDPGVGSSRKALAIQTSNYYFLAPDNGVLSYAIEKEKIQKIISLENKKYFLKKISSTFHGRDIFAPVAAHIALGVNIAKMGKAISEIKKIPFPLVRINKTKKEIIMEGEIVFTDSFGNMISNISKDIFVKSFNCKQVKVFAGKNLIGDIKKSYSDVPKGRALAIWGSYEYLEISIREGSAFRKFGCKSPVIIKSGTHPNLNSYKSTATAKCLPAFLPSLR